MRSGVERCFMELFAVCIHINNVDTQKLVQVGKRANTVRPFVLSFRSLYHLHYPPKKTGTNKVRSCLRFNYVSDVKSYLAVIITLEHLFSMSLVSVALPCDKANDRYKNKSEKHRKCACVDR